MATVQKIREGVFLISWSTHNPGYYGQPSEANVNIDEISQSFKLSFHQSSNYTNIFGVEINPIPSTITDNKKSQVLKPSFIALKNGVQHPMKLQNSKWTATCTDQCICGSMTDVFNFNILIDFNLTSMRKESQRVLDHIFNLWETKTLTDVTFKFEDKEVKAHTLILASGSPVLAAMFMNYFKEKHERVVVIKDIKSSVFEKMLRYIYTGEASLDNVDVVDLLIAANKYGVDSLKQDCATHLILNLSEKNAIRYLILSHLHEAPSLHKAALEFISQNAVAIVSRQDWVDLMKNYHEICLTAVKMIALAKK